MSLKSFSVACDWPGCSNVGIIRVVEGSELWDGWRTLSSPFSGDHLCKEHQDKSEDDLSNVRRLGRESNQHARKVLDKINMGDAGVMSGAKAFFDVVFPGCGEVWVRAVKEARTR